MAHSEVVNVSGNDLLPEMAVECAGAVHRAQVRVLQDESLIQFPY
jgi:hypothetical protein